MKILTRCLIPWACYAITLLAFLSIALKDIDVEEPAWTDVMEKLSQTGRLLADAGQAVVMSEEEKMLLV